MTSELLEKMVEDVFKKAYGEISTINKITCVQIGRNKSSYKISANYLGKKNEEHKISTIKIKDIEIPYYLDGKPTMFGEQLDDYLATLVKEYSE